MIALIMGAALACVVEVAPGQVIVDGTAYDLRRERVAEAARAVEDCGGDGVALMEWRRQVRLSWATGIGGAFVVVPVLWTPRHIARARLWRGRAFEVGDGL